MSRVLSARIPDQLFDDIENLVAGGQFKNRSDAVTHLLREGLNPGSNLEESALRRILREELSRLQIAGTGQKPVPANEAKRAKMLAQCEA